jgi:acyl-coenzyme A thioesterase PaaI-like protein
MAGDRWGTWFWSAFDPASGTDVNMACGFEAVGLTDDLGSLRWRPRREVFTYLPDAGDFVFGGGVGVALHCGIMAAASVVLADDEFLMTLQEEHRFIRPVSFEDTYLITGTPTRRTRRTLWTSTTIVSESSGQTVADATSVNQFIQRIDS